MVPCDTLTLVLRQVTVNGQKLEVELEPEGAFRIDGREGNASIVELEAGSFSIIIAGRSYEARVRAGTVYVNGSRYDVEVHDPRSVAVRKASTGSGHHTVKAAMPGKVIRVLVSEGDAVRAGQGILVMEAMKMQNEVKSPADGKVVSVSAAEGTAVTAGQTLAIVEAA